jgi:hypothetical protein
VIKAVTWTDDLSAPADAGEPGERHGGPMEA